MSLAVSETFYSHQGEGPSAGQSSIFLRLKGCNLTCGGPNTSKSGVLEEGATWRCDTIEVWKRGQSIAYDTIIEDWIAKGWHHASRLVITGGEPLLHSKALDLFLPLVKQKLPHLGIEIETNGTLSFSKKSDPYIDQYNVSPKLHNSGMKKEKRILSNALKSFVQNPKSIFKFVLTSSDDYNEINHDFIDTFKIEAHRIWLMPAADNQSDLLKHSPHIAQLALDKHHHFSNRLHIMIWDQKTGI